MATGKLKRILLPDGTPLTFFNQRCAGWDHLYEYDGNGSTLADAGCGIFALCHCAEYLTGRVQDPVRWGNFACAKGGRGDDGTDRPLLLHTLTVCGENVGLGFRYEEDGLRNDTDTLFDLLYAGRAVALCNLRPGHIVALPAARIVDGRKQLLAVDSYAESADPRVRDHVTEVVPGTEIGYDVRNAAGLTVGSAVSHGVYWVTADTPRDFNLLYRI